MTCFTSQTPEAEELAMISVQLASKFLFNVGFHTKKTLRYEPNRLTYSSFLEQTYSTTSTFNFVGDSQVVDDP